MTVAACSGLTPQPATKHQTAAHSPLPLPVAWGGEMGKKENLGGKTKIV